jgi:hypothetical protein
MSQTVTEPPLAPGSRQDGQHRRLWTLAVLVVSSPLLFALCVSIWKTPYPVNETVAVLEDVQLAPHWYSYFDPTARSWYRPLYFLTWDRLWRGTGSLDMALWLFKMIEVAAPLALVVLFIWQLRPRSLLEGAAAWCAVAVLIGTPGFRENLEVPLLMTLVAMPLALIVWMLLTRAPRPWHGPTILLLTLIAIGYKEQGLVIAPVVVIAWWTRAPGAGPRVTAAVVAATVAYLGFRLAFRQNWPVFEQSVGLGFQILEPTQALARFGAFPYGMYAYNALSTISNVLFSEPTGGLFAIARDAAYWRVQSWEIVYVVGSVTLTATIGWWARRVIPGLGRDGWTPEGRVALAFIISLLASGALSYLYSRDRLGGMTAVFYALASYAAIRHVAEQASRTELVTGRRLAAITALLAVMALTWHVRAVGTLERTRHMSASNGVAWLTQMPRRRLRFTERRVYLGIMNHMVSQGTEADAVLPSNYPTFVQRILGPELPQQ